VLDCVAKHEATRLIRDVLAGRRGSEEVRQKFKRTLEDIGSSCAKIYR